MINLSRKPIEKESVEPASRYSYPQLAFKLPALAPGQNSIGTGGQYSTGANSAGEPSKLYCSNHNQQRSESARRNYQRDRQAIDEYQILIQKIWSEQAGWLPTWDIAAHAYVKREAYRYLQYLRPLQHRLPSGKIHELVAQGITNQSEIARQLGVSRQAVSAALKHKKL